jgi:hypothetical protein
MRQPCPRPLSRGEGRRDKTLEKASVKLFLCEYLGSKKKKTHHPHIPYAGRLLRRALARGCRAGS